MKFELHALEVRRLFTAPAAPLINEPETNGQVVSHFDVHMEVDPLAFSDADGHTHHATSWQIRETAGAGGAVVWQALNVSDPLSKVHIHLGDGTFVGTLAGQTALLPSHNYVLHATFTDSNNETSATSQRTFTTQAPTMPVPGEGTWIVREGYKLELAAPAQAFRMPVNIAFVPNPGPNANDPLYYVTELYGSIKVVTRGGSISNYATGLLDYNPQGPISGTGEQGLTGIAVDPVSGDLFVGMLWNNGTSDSTRGGSTLHYPKVERLHSNDGGRTMATRTIIRNMQPETQGQSHQISNISIGPDNKLYVHMGDGFNAASALDLNQYRGKVLRMNFDGTAPTDNPLYNGGTINARDYIYTYGHRNAFGGAWRASNNKHWVVENGNSLDRMVDLTAGASYGWAGNDSALSANAKYVWNPATAPVNITFIQPQTFGGSLFPAGSQDDPFVTLSGPTYAAGPQSASKSIVQFPNIDTLVNGKISTPPVTLIKYNGTGRATVSALAAGPDGLYFSDLYRDDGVGGATALGSNVYRLRYVDFEPGSLAASPGHGQVTLNWANDPLAASTNVYRFVNHGDAPVLIGTGITGTSFTDTNLVAGVSYHYFARAVNAGGESYDSNEVHATATIPSTFTGTAAADTYILKRSGANLDVWVGGDGTGAPTYRVVYSFAPAMTFNANGADDALTIDNSAGDSIPAGGVTFNGGEGVDALHILGSSAAETITYNTGSVMIGAGITHADLETRTFDGNGGADSLTINGGGVAARDEMRLGALAIASGATLDLREHDLLVEYTGESSYETIRGYARGGAIVTAPSPAGVTTIAVVDNAQFARGDWNGAPIAPQTIIAKRVFYGDANMDGRVSSDDYVAVDVNLGKDDGTREWFHGDFNFDRRVTSDDYVAIDVNLGKGAPTEPVAATPEPVEIEAVPLVIAPTSEPARPKRPIDEIERLVHRAYKFVNRRAPRARR